ncbi:MAG: hypothetical protein M3347_18755 [Armatimonadota bacterium]|nr:hypothetical protein [Armatimonadota bacterium]
MSIIVRRKNAGVLLPVDYIQVLTDWRVEIIESADFRLEAAEDSLVQASFAFIEHYSLNATDAIVLSSALTVAQALRAAGDDLVLVASDNRLLSAAQAAGVATFNPETDSQQILDTMIAGS